MSLNHLQDEMKFHMVGKIKEKKDNFRCLKMPSEKSIQWPGRAQTGTQRGCCSYKLFVRTKQN